MGSAQEEEKQAAYSERDSVVLELGTLRQQHGSVEKQLDALKQQYSALEEQHAAAVKSAADEASVEKAQQQLQEAVQVKCSLEEELAAERERVLRGNQVEQDLLAHLQQAKVSASVMASTCMHALSEPTPRVASERSALVWHSTKLVG